MVIIKSKYLDEKPLTFPVSMISGSRFIGLTTMGYLVSHDTSFTMVKLLIMLIPFFIFTFNSHYQHTVCYQSCIKGFQIHIGEFGAYPVQPMDTFQTYDNRLNKMNFNNHIPDDVSVCNNKLVGGNRNLCYQFCSEIFFTNVIHGQMKGKGDLEALSEIEQTDI
jgi:hypothetical protein